MSRFDIKLHVGNLHPEQVGRLRLSTCTYLNPPRPTPWDFDLAATMALSTPGDFAAVARQHRHPAFRHADSLIHAVTAESGLSARLPRRIGFLPL